MGRTVLFAVTDDPAIPMKRVISFHKRKEAFSFSHQENGRLMSFYSIYSLREVQDLVDAFKFTHTGEELLPKPALQELARALRDFARNRMWESPEKLEAAIERFKRIWPEKTPVSIDSC